MALFLYCRNTGIGVVSMMARVGSMITPFIVLLVCIFNIIPRARMGSESVAHEAEGRMGY